jgi:coenzyme F420-0:L-glutamate ligase / coenzyme F420-1:gamma-L-glutamate ligase
VTELSERDHALLRDARRGVLATIARDGTPRLVPIAFVFAPAGVIYSALDEKPKSLTDPRELARVHDIQARPRVSVLADEWSEDWSGLAWVRVVGTARLVDPDGDSASEHAEAVRLLRAKYLQYETHALESRPVIRIEVERVVSWFATP